MHSPIPPLTLLSHPYRTLRPVEGDRLDLKKMSPRAGAALVWTLKDGVVEKHLELVRRRPGGTALVLILPPAALIRPPQTYLRVIEVTRPAGILPYHEVPEPDELAHVLRRPPSDLAAEVADYIAWRGIRYSSDARHLIRRTIELSAELRSVRALSRSMYLSRRALGRRLESEGLPVPSHWLHFSRLLRVALRLQNSDDSVVQAGFRVGYPDGFSLSNQMFRLTGYRPTEARKFLGWEWFVEAWLRREAEAGGLVLGDPAVAETDKAATPPSMRKTRPAKRKSSRKTGN